MPEIFNSIDWHRILTNGVYIVIAFVLTLPVGLNREHASQLGLRTIPLVAVAACGFMLIARTQFAGDPQAQARIVQGLITGVGFLGGGAIVKHGSSVHGTSTAAAIWCTAAIGTATALQYFEIAIVLSAFNLGILILLKPFKVHEVDVEQDDA